MTDNEIIKAVGCCIGNTKCDECPMFRTQNCMNKVFGYALDLINRQKAEIERLTNKLEQREEMMANLGVEFTTIQGTANYYKMHYEKAQAEIERLYIEGLQINKTFMDFVNKQIAEAIKEFAEELEYFVLNEDIEIVEPKCKDYESYINGANQFRHQIKNGINNLVKEMMEVGK